jgi:hypothetical protein
MARVPHRDATWHLVRNMAMLIMVRRKNEVLRWRNERAERFPEGREV